MSQSNIKILSYTWFSEMGSFYPIGVVHVHNGFYEQAYIGTGNGSNQEEDIQHIVKCGAKFPLAALPALGMTPYTAPQTATSDTPSL